MPTQSVTADAAVQNLARSLDDILPTGGTATATSGSTTTLTIGGEIGSRVAGSLIGSTIYTVSGTGIGQTLRVTAHTVSSGVATLTFPTATALGADTVFYLTNLSGRGRSRQQYLDAINNAIDSANARTFTDISSITCALEEGNGSTTPAGMQRYEYPPPSGFLYLWGVDALRERPLETNNTGFLNTQRSFGDVTARTRVSQGFQLTQQALVEFVAVYMGKVGAPTDNVWVTLETNGASIPSGTLLTNGTSQVVAGTTLQTRMRLVVFQFSPPVLVPASTQYHFALQRTGDTADAASYYVVGEDNANQYPNGALSTRNATVWSAVSGSDLLFAISPQGDWAPLARSRWELRQASTDSLMIRWGPRYHPYGPRSYQTVFLCEGTPIQLRGGAPIARVTAATDVVPLEPDYVQTYALWVLKGNRSGAVSSENAQMGAASIGQRLPSIQVPSRPFPSGTVRLTH